MIKKVCILSLLLIFKIHSQVNGEVFVLDEDRDIFYLYYTPSIMKDDLFEYQKVNMKLGLPPIKMNTITIYNTIGVDYHHFKYQSGVPEFSNSTDRFYNINYSLLLKYKISENWSFNALTMPHIISNLKGNIEADDLNINGIVFIEKTFHKKNSTGYYKLTFGAGYLTMAGKTSITPTVNLMARVNDKLSFVLGIPNTYIKYNLNDKHSIKFLGDLNDFSANLNTPIHLRNTEIDRAIYTSISAGLEYNYSINSSLGIMARGLYSVYDNYELQDSNENTVFDFNPKSKPSITVGIKFNPFH
ncbi:hypothetical protein ATE84_3094 [Aquimarina sp. MAR_2010_214]|uniref:DUF6268 family outer membrane beta-barrel protein n=1 Tax=Aquimarina sp. MAR_2010_214 TaxID=1250026 RepID=UPI000C712A2B|nr:DUF6268 family outer membrane beta-barrel protein [Aquimarina sp. MAR_2010_214]PKV51025.1 hypothetical protein ATE84_3094 [Aquimarina sp. MAR_2010_214]